MTPKNLVYASPIAAPPGQGHPCEYLIEAVNLGVAGTLAVTCGAPAVVRFENRATGLNIRLCHTHAHQEYPVEWKNLADAMSRD